MKIINSIIKLKSELLPLKNSTIGFVPTMGALHDGHLSLIEKSKKENDFTICSIFVNPTQFNNKEDFEKYPNTINEDTKLLEKQNCDFLFLPSSKEIYSSKSILKFDFGNLENTMEGRFRPGHFSGVALIVSKLFNIVNPTKAYFGQKDFQQLAIIKQLVIDLSFDVEVISCPTIREKNGLAMSSRNERLSKHEKHESSIIHNSLQLAKTKLLSLKKTDIIDIKAEIELQFENSNLQLEYLEIVSSTSLEPILTNENLNNTTICIAAFCGNVRLIDNITL